MSKILVKGPTRDLILKLSAKIQTEIDAVGVYHSAAVAYVCCIFMVKWAQGGNKSREITHGLLDETWERTVAETGGRATVAEVLDVWDHGRPTDELEGQILGLVKALVAGLERIGNPDLAPLCAYCYSAFVVHHALAADREKASVHKLIDTVWDMGEKRIEKDDVLRTLGEWREEGMGKGREGPVT